MSSGVFRHTEAPETTRERENSASTEFSDLLTARIKSFTQKESSLTLRMSLVMKREAEMRESAQQLGIDVERWSGSLLYNKFVKEKQPHVVLDPERTCALQNYSQLLQWEPWLTELISEYYHTGKLRVRSSCVGFDVLLCLEYFGILYSPEQLLFDSYDAYTRVRLWSDYFTQRAPTADWVAQIVVDSPENDLHFQFAVTPPQEANEKILSGGKPVRRLQGSPEETLWRFFGGGRRDLDSESMRQDFGMYLQNILTCVEVTFSCKVVSIDSREEMRALLTVRVVTKLSPANSPIRTKSELSFPLDELVEEDNGKLDRLVAASPRNDESPKYVLDDIYKHVYADLQDGDLKQYDMKYDTPPRPSLRRVGTGTSSVSNAVPIGVIDISANRSMDKSVTSALTGPFFRDRSGRFRDVDDAEDGVHALRQDWIQGKIFNSGLAGRVREMMDDEVRDESFDRSQLVGDSWEWFRSLCITTCDSVRATPCHKVGTTQDTVSTQESTESTGGDFVAPTLAVPHHHRESGTKGSVSAHEDNQYRGPTTKGPVSAHEDNPYRGSGSKGFASIHQEKQSILDASHPVSDLQPLQSSAGESSAISPVALKVDSPLVGINKDDSPFPTMSTESRRLESEAEVSHRPEKIIDTQPQDRAKRPTQPVIPKSRQTRPPKARLAHGPTKKTGTSTKMQTPSSKKASAITKQTRKSGSHPSPVAGAGGGKTSRRGIFWRRKKK